MSGTFHFDTNFESSVWKLFILCGILPMKVVHIVLGRPWLLYERVQHNGYENTYILIHDRKK